MKSLIPFLLLVLIHHFFLAPLIRKKLPLYLGLTISLLVLFGIYCFSFERRSGPPPQQIERPGLPPQNMERPAPPPPELERLGPRPPEMEQRGPLRPEFMKMIVGILLVGVDLGAYFYVESRRKERRMKELQAENLRGQLESLRFQINPHFFMNTLNNIHALVDIDPEKAKESIEVFSKMMRILLYEGHSPTIPLAKELDFIEHFISLMRLRYPEESVRIVTVFPEERSGVTVPPLLMASFVENAFKHGVSYSSDSYIKVSVERQDDRVIFHCSNSSHPSESDGQHGVGLDNIKKRLELLYGKGYTLSIEEKDGCHDVLMTIPQQPDIQLS